MKVALVLGLALFCSLWTGGLLLKCLSCGGEGVVTYEVCQESQTVVNCSANQVCFQVEVRSEEGANETRSVAKGCLNKDKCDAYRKGDITDCSNCKGECCSNEDECNKGNLLSNQGSAFVISVMVLLLSVLLTLGSVNDFVKLQFL